MPIYVGLERVLGCVCLYMKGNRCSAVREEWKERREMEGTLVGKNEGNPFSFYSSGKERKEQDSNFEWP